MDIKKVITDKYYKRKYISTKDSIYEVEYFKYSYPELTAKIDAVISKSNKIGLKPARNLIKVKFKPFPSADKMLDIIKEEKIKIYNKLGLNDITGENAPIIKAMLIYEYLCKNAKYDMTTQEDSANMKEAFAADDKFNKKYKLLQTKYVVDFEKLKNAQNDVKAKALAGSLEKTIYKIKALNEEATTYALNFVDCQTVKAMYNTIMFNKGVCSNFSYAYQFLLEGCGLNAYSIEAADESKSHMHVYNMLEVSSVTDLKYYIVDLTVGVMLKNESPFEIIESFAINKEKYFNAIKDKSTSTIKLLNPLRENSKNIIKDLAPEPTFSIMREKIEDITSLTKEKQQALKLILRRDIKKLEVNSKEPVL